MDDDVEIEPLIPEDGATQQVRIAPALQHFEQRFQQIAVLAAQVDQAAAGTDDVCGDRHALEHRIGPAAQQHAVLEGARFAFVGVAHHHALCSGGLAAQLPFEPGHEARATPAAQVGAFHLGQHRVRPARQRRRQCEPRRRCVAEQHIGTLDVVLHIEPLGRPLRHRHARADQLGHLRHAGAVEPGHDLMVIDEQGRALVAQAGARGFIHAHDSVVAEPPGRHTQVPAEISHQRLTAEQAVSDVVAEQDAVDTDGLGVEETIETRHALHMGQ